MPVTAQSWQAYSVMQRKHVHNILVSVFYSAPEPIDASPDSGRSDENSRSTSFLFFIFSFLIGRTDGFLSNSHHYMTVSGKVKY